MVTQEKLKRMKMDILYEEHKNLRSRKKNDGKMVVELMKIIDGHIKRRM